MPKAINWPEKYLGEILREDSESVRVAIRADRIYFDNNYFRNGDTVDIRIAHKVVRQAVIDNMRLKKIKELSFFEIAAYKSDLNDIDNIINFLSENYNKQVDSETEIVVIKYKNLPIEFLDRADDPHPL